MKQLLKVIGTILFYVFILAVAGWTASLTLAEVKLILPGDPVTPFFALALFDGGAVVWLLAFIGHAKGLMQRAISILLLVIDLTGVVILSAGRLLTGGQELATISKDVGAYMVYAVIGATIINLIAIYAFHIADPDTMQQIELQTLDDSIQAEALAQARSNIENEVQQLAAILAARATGRLKYSLRLPMNNIETHEVLADESSPTPLVIPAKRITQASQGVPAWLLNFGRKFATRRNESGKVYEQNVAVPIATMPINATKQANPVTMDTKQDNKEVPQVDFFRTGTEEA